MLHRANYSQAYDCEPREPRANNILYPQLCQGAGVHESGVTGEAALLLDWGPHVGGPRHLAQRQAVHPGQLVTHRRVSYTS